MKPDHEPQRFDESSDEIAPATSPNAPSAPPDWLGGTWRVGAGATSDYHELARYHYLAGKPATWA
ncbi:MAG: hypothetical protein AAGK78_13900, partial [Planctomycetota bacterium]